jgi:hypothetical protein
VRKPVTSLGGMLLPWIGDEPPGPRVEVPELSDLPQVEKLLDYERIQPHKMRKGKSGERNNNGGKQRR